MNKELIILDEKYILNLSTLKDILLIEKHLQRHLMFTKTK